MHPFYDSNLLLLLSQDNTFLEACIENHTKSNLYMDQVEFEPSQHWTATVLKAGEGLSDNDSPTRCCDRCLIWDDVFPFVESIFITNAFLCACVNVTWCAFLLKLILSSFFNDYNILTLTDREIFKQPILIRSGGGIQNYLYQLKLSSQGSAQMKVDGSNVLGKLQITWRTNLGEPGRLQTQQILGSVSDHCL